MTGTYGKTSAAATRRRSNRAKVEWVPVTQLAYGKAICAANLAEVDLAIWIDEAITAHLDRTERELHEAEFQSARREACDQLRGEVYRHEFTPTEHMPFVRRPAGVTDNHQAGRPSSRHHPEATAHRGGQGRGAGPEPRAAAGAPRRGEHGEDPSLARAEHRGTARPQQPVR